MRTCLILVFLAAGCSDDTAPAVDAALDSARDVVADKLMQVEGRPDLGPCLSKEQQYLHALAEAKACTATSECTETADDELACPCQTYLNPANSEALARLAELRSQWDVKQCGVDCPEVTCPRPRGATCEPQSGGGKTGGLCTDRK